ncbi:hypothetical protein GUJ93_ZPchr0013g36180 [Zizania palustris]|uniref:Uncharacterized protein n=1 Tax=Zizania palustris TaxID=103762 RepID=A0A8J5WUN9_ZIZPA|nr:hypothetical protein GUJ93_ZPchr0013g36180 [Zizania palustris]
MVVETLVEPKMAMVGATWVRGEGRAMGEHKQCGVELGGSDGLGGRKRWYMFWRMRDWCIGMAIGCYGYG